MILVELGERTFEGELAARDLQALDEIAGAHEQHAPSAQGHRATPPDIFPGAGADPVDARATSLSDRDRNGQAKRSPVWHVRPRRRALRVAGPPSISRCAR